jgi:hypothetical protein
MGWDDLRIVLAVFREGTLSGAAGELAPQRLHFRRSIEPKESAERGRVSFLELFRPLDA